MKPNARAEPPSLVPPAFCEYPDYHHTYGPEVADLATMAGYEPDPEQRLALDVMFGVDRRGQSTAFEMAVIVARQNLKTGLLKQAALGWLYLTDQRLVVWSAHKFSTTQEAHRDLSEMIQGCGYLDRRIKQIYNSAADKSIELKTGARVVFKARTNTGGRGLSGNKVVLDEGFALLPSHMGSLVPALSAMPDPQLVYASSAGLASSAVLRGIRDRGRYGLSARLAYLEWCSKPGGCELEQCDHSLGAPGCALDDVVKLQEANPMLNRVRANGTGLQLATLLSEREALSQDPMEYARERHGWWDDPGASEIFGAGKYEACGAPTPLGVKLEAVAVTLTVDLKHAAVVGAGRIGARVYVQVLAHGPGYDWVADLLPANVPVLVASKSPAAVMVPDLQDEGVEVEVITVSEECDAFAEFYNLVVTGQLMHDRDPLLITAVNGAVTRQVGDRQAWGRRKSTADITSVEAATLAAWWSTLPIEEPAPEPEPAALAPAPAAHNELLTMGF